MTELVRQRLALDQLQDERSQSVALLDAVDRADVRMIQRREEACLALEAREAIRIGSERCGQDLDGDIAPKLRIARPIHFTPRARAQGRDDLVVIEPTPAVITFPIARSSIMSVSVSGKLPTTTGAIVIVLSQRSN